MRVLQGLAARQAALALVLFLLLCLRTALSQSQQTTLTGVLKVGVTASITGEFSEWSDAINGYTLWEKYVNAGGGIIIRDASGNYYQYAVRLAVIDDGSTAAGHASAVQTLLNVNKTHFFLGASPAFADAESIIVHNAGRLCFHCCAGAASVYSRGQENVFGMSVDNSAYPRELFTEFRANNVYKLAVVYRSDVLELRSACVAAVEWAKQQLLTITLEVPYNNGSDATLASVATELAASSAEALVMCGLSSESSSMVRLIDERRKPLKAMVFTGGAYTREWNDRLGNLSVAVTSFAHWAPDLARKDSFWGDSPTYAAKYKSAYNKDATYVAAAASATGYVLQTVLQDAFKACTLSPAALADPSVLLFTHGAITCSDNNNRGHDRIVAALAVTQMDTFFGTLNFNKYHQNQGYDPVTLQTYQTIENLQQAYKPSLVLPLSSATRPLLLPQPNRYAVTCQPGTYRGTDDFLPCSPCPFGQFQEFTGRSTCELCPRDHYANVTGMAECVACPANTITIQRGSTNLTDCVCKVGFFAPSGLPGLPCEACPSNADCEGGTAMPSPLPGFYAERDAPFTMYPCNPGSVCTGNFTCAEGYRGRMCAYCAKGYFRFLGNCVSCPSDSNSVIGYLIVMAALWITVNLSFARTIENLMVIINFCQLLSIMVSFSLNWPQHLYQIMSVSSILSFEMDSLEPSCLVHDWGFAHNLAVQLLLPLLMAALVAIWCGVTWLMYRYKQTGYTRSVKAAASYKMAHEPPWKQVLTSILNIPVDRRELQDTMLERAAIPLNFLNIGFLVQFKYNLSTFQCKTINGTKYMAASPNDKCYTQKHWNMMLLGVSGLIVYNFGFAFLYGHVIRQLRKHRALGDKKPLLLYGWMYERYEAQYYWYETIVLLQRMGFVLVALFVPDPALQAVLCMLISVSVLLMDVHTSAYVDKQIHTIQAIADGVLGALLVAGLLFYNPLSDRTVVRVVEFVLLAAVVCAFGSGIVSVLQGIAVRVLVLWMMSKHRPIAHKVGQRVKGYRHMYQVFGPIFLFKWLRGCSQQEWDDWHHLCMVLIDYVHPTSDVSYLSLKKVGRFWRYLLSNFPETIDYLVSVTPEEREHFNNFVEVLYDHFFDTKDEHRYQVYYFINDKFKAAFAQWLSSCDEDDREFCQRVMKTALGKAKGAQAAAELSAALSRSSRVSSAATVLEAAAKFKKALPPIQPSPNRRFSSLMSTSRTLTNNGALSVRFRDSDAALALSNMLNNCQSSGLVGSSATPSGDGQAPACERKMRGGGNPYAKQSLADSMWGEGTPKEQEPGSGKSFELTMSSIKSRTPTPPPLPDSSPASPALAKPAGGTDTPPPGMRAAAAAASVPTLERQLRPISPVVVAAECVAETAGGASPFSSAAAVVTEAGVRPPSRHELPASPAGKPQQPLESGAMLTAANAPDAGVTRRGSSVRRLLGSPSVTPCFADAAGAGDKGGGGDDGGGGSTAASPSRRVATAKLGQQEGRHNEGDVVVQLGDPDAVEDHGAESDSDYFGSRRGASPRERSGHGGGGSGGSGMPLRLRGDSADSLCEFAGEELQYAVPAPMLQLPMPRSIATPQVAPGVSASGMLPQQRSMTATLLGTSFVRHAEAGAVGDAAARIRAGAVSPGPALPSAAASPVRGRPERVEEVAITGEVRPFDAEGLQGE